jgi:hypothetical protein
LLRAVVVSIAVAVLGVLYILANPEDAGVKAFGWLLVAVGSVIAGLLTVLWAREQFKAAEAGGTAGSGRSGARGDHRRRRGR